MTTPQPPDPAVEEHGHATFSWGTIHWFWQRTPGSLSQATHRLIGVQFPNEPPTQVDAPVETEEAAMTRVITLLREYTQRRGLPPS